MKILCNRREGAWRFANDTSWKKGPGYSIKYYHNGLKNFATKNEDHVEITGDEEEGYEKWKLDDAQ